MSLLTLKISKDLLSKLEEYAAQRGEMPEEFAVKALQSAVNMWEDFDMADDEFDALLGDGVHMDA